MGDGPDLPALLARITTLANESKDTATTLRNAAADIAATTGLEISEIRLDAPQDAGSMPWSVAITSGEHTVASISFAPPPDRSVPSPQLAATMDAVARQLGLVMERDRTRAALEAATLELERSNRELEQFAYVASHDLQEPLRKIVGFSELLEDRYGDHLEGDASEYLGYVTEGARRMSRLIEDLLRYSRVGRRRPELRPTALDPLVAEVLEVLSGRVADANAEVTVAWPLPAALGDPDQLRDLLMNLVGNALKYRGDEPPRVTISATSQDDGWFAVTVADNGIGLDPLHGERIFEVFQRLHARTAYEGSGIGLAICRRIVEHHGGRIWVESRPGEGARFTFTLPAAPEVPDA